jgi:hypothetical protein
MFNSCFSGEGGLESPDVWHLQIPIVEIHIVAYDNNKFKLPIV